MEPIPSSRHCRQKEIDSLLQDNHNVSDGETSSNSSGSQHAAEQNDINTLAIVEENQRSLFVRFTPSSSSENRFCCTAGIDNETTTLLCNSDVSAVTVVRQGFVECSNSHTVEIVDTSAPRARNVSLHPLMETHLDLDAIQNDSTFDPKASHDDQYQENNQTTDDDSSLQLNAQQLNSKYFRCIYH
jgi:hypothetical protein